MRIYLIGLMGSGKTTAGKALAKKLSFTFLDLDELIEENTGFSIADYFAKFGENQFRLVEKECLQKTFSFENAVISTGGGTPCFFNNMDDILLHGISFYLKGNEKLLVSRLMSAKNDRPLINNLDENQLIQKLKELFVLREKFYAQANFTVHAINPVPEMLAVLKYQFRIE
jgi:shikimate kinase